MTPAVLDQMRRALARCTFPPGSPQKRFARSVTGIPLAALTEKQRRHIIRLTWRYRRQMPRDLVPSGDAVKALDADWRPQPRSPAIHAAADVPMVVRQPDLF